MTNIIFTVYFAAILAALIINNQKKKNELETSLSLVKGLTFTVAKSEEELDNCTEHHFQIGFGFVILTMSWLEYAE